MNTKDEQLEEDKEEAVIFGMSLPGGYISSQGNQAKWNRFKIQILFPFKG